MGDTSSRSGSWFGSKRDEVCAFPANWSTLFSSNPDKASSVRIGSELPWYLSIPERAEHAVSDSRLKAALDPGNEKDLGVRVELPDQDGSLIRNVRCKPSLRHLLVEFLFDFG